jgi:hypothetical protein
MSAQRATAPPQHMETLIHQGLPKPVDMSRLNRTVFSISPIASATNFSDSTSRNLSSQSSQSSVSEEDTFGTAISIYQDAHDINFWK